MIKNLLKTFVITFVTVGMLGYCGAYFVNWNNAFTVNRAQEIAYWAEYDKCSDVLRPMFNGWSGAYGVVVACKEQAYKKTNFIKVEKNFLLPIFRATKFN